MYAKPNKLEKYTEDWVVSPVLVLRDYEVHPAELAGASLNPQHFLFTFYFATFKIQF